MDMASRTSNASSCPPMITDHVRGMYKLLQHGHDTGTQPWARLWAQGHGEHWGPAADYINRNAHLWAAALLRDSREQSD